jgi:hypothetical protein
VFEEFFRKVKAFIAGAIVISAIGYFIVAYPADAVTVFGAIFSGIGWVFVHLFAFIHLIIARLQHK